MKTSRCYRGVKKAERRAAAELADALVSDTRPVFCECTVCMHWHPVEFRGDCRDNANRFTSGYLNNRYGFNGWRHKYAD